VIPSTAPFGKLTELQSAGIANFNSANISVRQAVWKGLSLTANYIWGKKMDDGSGPTNMLNNASSCTNCANGAFPDGIKGPGIKMDYGVGSGDTRHTFDGFVSYSLPKFHFIPKLTQGWQMNALWSFYTGGALNPTIGGTEYSLQGESGDRPSYNPGFCTSGTNCSSKPYMAKQVYTTATGARVYITQNATVIQGSNKSISSVTNTYDYPIHGITVPYYNPTGAYGTAVANTNTFGVYGNLRRDVLVGTAFGDVDFSLFKYTPITERVKSEFRVEIFNLFNQSNLASPSVTTSGSSYGEITNTLNASGNPGMGYGEPFNIQFALKILF
jgi:hypothetical protein